MNVCPICRSNNVLVSVTALFVPREDDNGRTGDPYGTPFLFPHHPAACNNAGCGWEGLYGDTQND